MKYLILIFSLIATQSSGQNNDIYSTYFTKNLDHDNYETKEYKLQHNGGNLIINGVADVSIESFNGSEVILTAEIEVEDSPQNERSKGLKVLDARGIDDNTGLGYSLTKKDGNLILTTLGHAHCDCTPLRIKLPKGIGLVLEDKTFRGEMILVKDFQDPIDISVNNHSIQLENVTGPMAVKTLHGHIDANFENVSQEGTISLTAVHDFVDVTLPSSTKADLTLKTQHGEIYSDMKIDMNQSDSNSSHVSKLVKGKLNGGGISMTISSNFNEVYLREK